MAVVHTMVEEIELQKTPIASAILRGILEPGQLWDKMKVATVRSFKVEGRRWKSLPSVKFAHIGEAYASGGGKTEAISFGLKHLGHDFDIPIAFEHTDHITDPKQLQLEMILKAWAYQLNNSLFNGDSAVNPREPDGLKKLSTALPARQLLDGSLTANGGDGTSLDLRAGGASSAIRQAFLDILAKAKRRCEDGTADLIAMNELLYDIFESIVRREGLYKVTEDQFQREVGSWRGLQFVDAGFGDIDGGTYILATDHDVPGAATPTTSMYFLKLDPQRHIGVLQTGPMDIRTLPELSNIASRRTRMDWDLGLVMWGKRSLVRVSKLRVA